MKTQVVPNPKTARTSTPANRTDNGQASLTAPLLVDFDPETFAKVQDTSTAFGITPEELSQRPPAKPEA